MAETEYSQAIAERDNLKSQYAELNGYDKNKPYIGQQMARDIYKITSQIKLWEHAEFERIAGIAKDRR